MARGMGMPDAHAGAERLNWKRDQIKGKKWKYNGMSAERIERAIADDIEFLRSHPTRQSRKRDEQ